MKAEAKLILWGLAIGGGLIVLNRATGGGLFRGFGESLGRAPVDAIGGALYGAFDSTTAIIGASDSDCARAKAAGDAMGIYWACWPKDWPIFK